MRYYKYNLRTGLTKVKTNTKKYVTSVATGLALAGSVVAPALAAKGPIGTFFSTAEPGTTGNLISGEIYGNTSNSSGNGNGVLPSLSPGPWVCGNPQDCAAEPTNAGGSMGDFIAPTASGGHGSPDFANSKPTGPDFSDQ
jgi:hypothetical protein